jgi:hypothetical protein
MPKFLVCDSLAVNADDISHIQLYENSAAVCLRGSCNRLTISRQDGERLMKQVGGRIRAGGAWYSNENYKPSTESASIKT